MKRSGVVRKIDDLGRIVIPKEIRKTLNIRDGETLEIGIEDGKISLVKMNIINNYLEDIKELCRAASTIIDGSIIVTDREKVIYVTDNLEKLSLNDKIPSSLSYIIDNRLTDISKEVKKHRFNDTDLIGYYIIYPIIDDGNSLGLVIIYNSNENIERYDLMGKLLAKMLANKLDISC